MIITIHELRRIIRDVMNESGVTTKYNTNRFPISGLIKFAKKFDTFEDFEHFYTMENNFGYYWHLTDNPKFKISDKTGPRDMSSMSDGSISEFGAVMVTTDLDFWNSHYNYNPDTGKKDIIRPYAVLFDASDVDPKYLKQINRGFGNEIYLHKNTAKSLKQIGVYNLKYAIQLDKKFTNLIPQSKSELMQLYTLAHKNI